MTALLRAAGALAAILLLSACLVTPGKFTSTLDIRADRSFTFSYRGEVIASDMGEQATTTGSGATDGPQGDDSAYMVPVLWQDDRAKAEERFDQPEPVDEKKMQAIAAALMKEKGFTSAHYVGNRKFDIDYAISGTLDHAFLFPFNIDAQIVLPFVAVELRGDDRVRVKAPGFANSFDKAQGPSMGTPSVGGPGEDAAEAMDGRFTLTTDAQIVSQNEESGATDTPRGKQIVWTVTPQTSEAPSATLRLRR
jgi:hypothetical protein